MNSIKNNKIYSEGTGILVYGESVANLTDSGVIGVIENGVENIKSSAEYDTIPIENFLTSVQLSVKSNFEKFALSQIIKNYFENKS